MWPYGYVYVVCVMDVIEQNKGVALEEKGIVTSKGTYGPRANKMFRTYTDKMEDMMVKGETLFCFGGMIYFCMRINWGKTR